METIIEGRIGSVLMDEKRSFLLEKLGWMTLRILGV
jgi:hypothetical protein